MFPTPKLNIGLDFDDTLMHTREALIAILNKAHNTNLHPDQCTDYYLSDHWNLSEEQFTAMFNAHEDHIHTQPPLEDLIPTLVSWQPHANFHIITGRPECWLPSALKWLATHNIPIVQIISARTAGGKGAASKLHNLDLFIEDHFTFAKEVADTNIPVLLINRPYNQNQSHPLITRVKDWQEIQTIVAEKYLPKTRLSA
jgi:uncharacterized HAD superfamily protein